MMYCTNNDLSTSLCRKIGQSENPEYFASPTLKFGIKTTRQRFQPKKSRISIFKDSEGKPIKYLGKSVKKEPLKKCLELEYDVAASKIADQKIKEYEKMINKQLEDSMKIAANPKPRINSISGPRWYQELSYDQLDNVMALENAMLEDKLEKKTILTHNCLKNIGIVRIPAKTIFNLQVKTQTNPVKFLREIYKILVGKSFEEEDYKNYYNCSERLIMTSIAALTLPEIIEELYERMPLKFLAFPKPPMQVSVKRIKKSNPYEENHELFLDWRRDRSEKLKFKKTKKEAAKPKKILLMKPYKNAESCDEVWEKEKEEPDNKKIEKEFGEHLEEKKDENENTKKEFDENVEEKKDENDKEEIISSEMKKCDAKKVRCNCHITEISSIESFQAEPSQKKFLVEKPNYSLKMHEFLNKLNCEFKVYEKTTDDLIKKVQKVANRVKLEPNCDDCCACRYIAKKEIEDKKTVNLTEGVVKDPDFKEKFLIGSTLINTPTPSIKGEPSKYQLCIQKNIPVINNITKIDEEPVIQISNFTIYKKDIKEIGEKKRKLNVPPCECEVEKSLIDKIVGDCCKKDSCCGQKYIPENDFCCIEEFDDKSDQFYSSFENHDEGEYVYHDYENISNFYGENYLSESSDSFVKNLPAENLPLKTSSPKSLSFKNLSADNLSIKNSAKKEKSEHLKNSSPLRCSKEKNKISQNQLVKKNDSEIEMPKLPLKLQVHKNALLNKTIVHLVDPIKPIEMISTKPEGKTCCCREIRNNTKQTVQGISGFTKTKIDKKTLKVPLLTEDICLVTPIPSPYVSNEYIPQYELKKPISYLDCNSDSEEKGVRMTELELTEYFLHNKKGLTCQDDPSKTTLPRTLEVMQAVCECKNKRKTVREQEEREKREARRKKLKSYNPKATYELSEIAEYPESKTIPIISGIVQVKEAGGKTKIEKFISGISEVKFHDEPVSVISEVNLHTPYETPTSSQTSLCDCLNKKFCTKSPSTYKLISFKINGSRKEDSVNNDKLKNKETIEPNSPEVNFEDERKNGQEKIPTEKIEKTEENVTADNKIEDYKNSEDKNDENMDDKVLLKKILEELKEKGNVFAMLPECEKVPQLKFWLMHRRGLYISKKDREESVESSRKQLQLVFKEFNFHKVEPPTLKMSANVTYDHAKKINEKIANLKNQFNNAIQQERLTRYIQFWNTFDYVKFFNKKSKSVNFCYFPRPQ